MREKFSAIQEGWQDFKAGGGVKTIARRFIQTAPFAAAGIGGAGFFTGEIGPALVESSSAANINQPINPTQPAYTPEHGPEWAVTGAEIGLAVAAIEAMIHPFVIGRQIRDGDLDEIPAMPNLGHYIIYGLGRSFDHIVNLSRDFQYGGGWREFNANLAIFGTAGSVLGIPAGLGVDDLITSYTNAEFMPIEATIAGVATGAVFGSYLALEVTAAEGRHLRREEEGMTTLRGLFRRKREREAATEEDPQTIPVLTPRRITQPLNEEFVQKVEQIDKQSP